MSRINALVVTSNRELKEDANFQVFENSSVNVIYADKINEAIFRTHGDKISIVLIVESDSHVISQLVRGLKCHENMTTVVVSSPEKVEMTDAIKQLKHFYKVSYPCNYAEILPLLQTKMNFKKDDLERAKVLIVDDLESNRKLIKEYLDGTILDADEAASGEEALDLIKIYKYKLVILDYQMPGLNGSETLMEIREQFSRKKLPVIIASAQNEIEVVKELIKLGAQDYLTKPISLNAFYEKISKVLKIKLP